MKLIRLFLVLNFVFFTLFLFALPLGLVFGLAVGEVDTEAARIFTWCSWSAGAIGGLLAFGLWRGNRCGALGGALFCGAIVSWFGWNLAFRRGDDLLSVGFVVYAILLAGLLLKKQKA